MACTPESLALCVSIGRAIAIEVVVAEKRSTAYFTEQHIHPFASSSHSSTCWPSLLTVRDFSMSAAAEMCVVRGNS